MAVQDTGWHYIGDPGEPTFQNSWVNYGTSWGAAAFRRIGDIVQLSGLIKSGTTTALIFTLPEGYRLSATTDGVARIFDGIGNNAVVRIDVGSNGTINGNPANATWTALDGIMYFTDDDFPA